jgi:hypothetical protein
MRDFAFWIRWIWVVGWILVAFGLSFALLNQVWPYDFAFNHRIDPVFWGAETPPANYHLFQGWVYGVLGAVVAGWGVFVVFLAKYPLQNRERWAWTCLLAGFGLWFVVDTAFSALFGVYFNVIFNSVLAALVFVPLMATRKEFR